MGIEVALLAGGLGAAVSAAGSLYKGQAGKQSAEYNARMDEQRAANERDMAAAATQDYLRKGSDHVESAVAMRGATGVTGEGSPLLVNENTVREVALGAARTMHAGEVKASRLQDDAQLQRMKGEHAVTASYLDAGSSLLTAGSRFANPGYGRGANY